MEQTKPIIVNGGSLQWICECGYANGATNYPIDLTKDSVEVVCGNATCKWFNKIVGVRIQKAEVIYVKQQQ